MMYDTIVFFVKILISMIDTYMIFLFLDTFCNLKRKSSYRYMCAGMIILILWVCGDIGNVYINLITYFVTICILALVFYDGKILSKIVYVSLYLLIILIGECLAYYITNIFYTVSAMDAANELVSNIPFVLITKMIQFTIINTFMRIGKKEENKILLGDFISIIAMMIISLVATLYLFLHEYVNAGTRNFLNLFIGVGLLLMDILIFTLFTKTKKLAQLEQDKKLMEQRMGMEVEKYEEYKIIQQNLKIMYHDINNHISCIKYLMGTNKDAAGVHLQQIETELKECGRFMFLGDTPIDAVLFSKIGRLKDLGISMDLNLNIDKNVNIAHADLCSILTNALDNAIEALQFVEGERRIELTAVQKSGFILIKVANDSMDGGEKDAHENIITKKKNREKHGIGLKSIKSTVDKYDGEMDAVFESNKFILSIMLNV